MSGGSDTEPLEPDSALDDIHTADETQENTEDIIDDAFDALEADEGESHPEDEHEPMDFYTVTEQEDEEYISEKDGSGDEMNIERSGDEHEDTAVEKDEFVPKTIRRPLSAWIIYSNEQRGAIKEANPDYGFKDMAQALSEGFKALSPEEREVYDRKAAADKERYIKETQEQQRLIALHKPAAGSAIDLSKAKSLAKELVFPLARIKRTVKLDPDVKNLQKEAVVAIAKATELFLAFLGLRSAQVASRNRRRTVKTPDVLEVVHTNPILQFLRKDFPLPKKVPKEPTAAVKNAMVQKTVEVSGKGAITSFFKKTKTDTTENVKRTHAEVVGGEEDENSSKKVAGHIPETSSDSDAGMKSTDLC
mmetsp:Transcript_12337/g.18702  ORF Transcript_12337/g.18702 Transcript_12337/m.18702 type:complete len:363 (+) Transcript_12337:93-1181(+)